MSCFGVLCFTYMHACTHVVIKFGPIGNWPIGAVSFESWSPQTMDFMQDFDDIDVDHEQLVPTDDVLCESSPPKSAVLVQSRAETRRLQYSVKIAKMNCARCKVNLHTPQRA